MHPPRRNTTRAIREHAGLVDHLTDWLLRNCPFSTLTTLTLLVIGALLPPIPRPILVAIPIALVDLTLVYWRRARRAPAEPRSRLQ